MTNKTFKEFRAAVAEFEEACSKLEKLIPRSEEALTVLQVIDLYEHGAGLRAHYKRDEGMSFMIGDKPISRRVYLKAQAWIATPRGES